MEVRTYVARTNEMYNERVCVVHSMQRLSRPPFFVALVLRFRCDVFCRLSSKRDPEKESDISKKIARNTDSITNTNICNLHTSHFYHDEPRCANHTTKQLTPPHEVLARFKMVRHHRVGVAILLVVVSLSSSFDFGIRRRKWGYLPPNEGHKATALAFRRRTQEEEEDGQRRRLFRDSTMSVLSSFVANLRPTPAAASTVILEDSEARRIGIFERNAPSVVFIDTFVEKQDAFSPNTMEVPLGSGSGFVWDKQGHIGKCCLLYTSPSPRD